MKLPRDLNGRRLVQGLCQNWDYNVVNQEGSHIILQTTSPRHQRISIPDHTPLRLGTLNSLLRLVATHKGVRKEDLLRSI